MVEKIRGCSAEGCAASSCALVSFEKQALSIVRGSSFFPFLSIGLWGGVFVCGCLFSIPFLYAWDPRFLTLEEIRDSTALKGVQIPLWLSV
ncbi:hypothetical protein GOBAR_AA33939 [Gossypium barbadense]|uniref:Uncharacterized protein n=1 Tax=Gossypium barbadense TaxID=3634 RepID=A0A2P5W6R6_GOSBA|nr:hypothetical protein GOBAR_AA33939 [Gossypium barbadense]